MLYVLVAYFAHILEITLITFVIKDTGPYVYITLSYIIAWLWVFLYEKITNKKGEKIPLKDIIVHKNILLCYIGGAFLGNALWFYSIFLIGMGTVSFILIFVRLFVAVYAYLYMNDRYPADKIAAFVTAFIALGFYSYSGLEQNWLGITLALISCFAFAAESIGKKKLSQTDMKPENMVLWRYSTLAIAFTLIFSVLFIGDFIPQDMLKIPSAFNLMLMTIACFVGSIGTNIILFYGLRTVQLSVHESLNSTKPVIFSIIGIFLLDETMTSSQFIWGIIILVASLYFVLPQRLDKKSV
jgi:drug/metabolite transporter (DMT)-like permease